MSRSRLRRGTIARRLRPASGRCRGPARSLVDDQDWDSADRRRAVDGDHAVPADQADDLLVQRRDERKLARFSSAGRGSCGPLSRPSSCSSSAISSTSRARVRGPGFADTAAWVRVSAWRRFGWARVSALRRFGAGSGSLSFAAVGAWTWSACASSAAPRRRATRPSPSRRGCADNARRPRASRSAPSRPCRTPACRTSSVSPTLPNRRLLGVRTRERTSLSPRLRAVSASASICSSLIACPARGG